MSKSTSSNAQLNKALSSNTLSNKRRLHWLPDLCRTEALGAVALLAVLMAIVLELLFRGLDFSISSFSESALLILWMVLIGCFLTCCVRRISLHWPDWLIVLSLILCFQAISFIGSWVQMLVTGESFLNKLIPSQLLAALIGIVALRIFYVQEQERLREERLKQAEIELLQARIQPHFLFNTLNSILSLIADQPDRAESAVLDLADLMRSSLAAGSQTLVLKEELSLCEKYLQIESLRMGERLKWDFKISDAATQMQLPALSLQPLVENAIVHGISQIPEGGCIDMQISMEAERLCISLSNPIPDNSQAVPQSGNRIAINNVIERLQAYSETPVMYSNSIKDNFYRVKIELTPGGQHE